MKKLFAIVLALVLALSTIPALAESALNWEDVEANVSEDDGTFYLIDELGIILWIPVEMNPVELDDKDAEAGLIGVFATEDGSCAVVIQYLNVKADALDDVVAVLVESGATDFEEVTVNGIPCLSFAMPEQDAGCLALASDEGDFLMFTFAPISDEVFSIVAGFIIASIQEAE